VPAARAAEIASRFLGTPYRYGGASPDGFDCSGLVWYVYRELGVPVPRTAAEQRAAARPVPRDDLQPGDLVFFHLPQDHVGIYLGGGQFVHAPATGRTVERARLDSPYFILSFAGAGRFAR
jgi:cell wall-associated NlpC family hydrolase